MKKAWLYIIALAVVAYLLLSKKSAAASSSTGKSVQVDSVALAAYKNGTATPQQMVQLGWPFIAEAELSFLSGPIGARVLGPMTNGPENRAGPELHESCLAAAQQLDPAYGTTVDGYTAKLAYMNARCQQYGRPKIYGFENQSQPHDL